MSKVLVAGRSVPHVRLSVTASAPRRLRFEVDVDTVRPYTAAAAIAAREAIMRVVEATLLAGDRVDPGAAGTPGGG